jgi:hypothetical protein
VAAVLVLVLMCSVVVVALPGAEAATMSTAVGLPFLLHQHSPWPELFRWLARGQLAAAGAAAMPLPLTRDA